MPQGVTLDPLTPAQVICRDLRAPMANRSLRGDDNGLCLSCPVQQPLVTGGYGVLEMYVTEEPAFDFI